MSRLALERKYVGKISIPDGAVDITDPSYDRDVWCRMNNVSITPGNYNCYAYMGNKKGWGNRCWKAQIALADGPLSDIAEERIASRKSWREIGYIGVDAGMAGFFNHKPDFNNEEWDDLCDKMFSGEEYVYIDSFEKDGLITRGFWTESGYGDGSYPVKAIREGGKIIALEIRFA